MLFSKLFLRLFLAVLFFGFSFAPAIANAASPGCNPSLGTCANSKEVTENVDPGGIVPCTTNCNYCSLLTMTQRSFNKLVLQLVPAIAIILILVGGFLMITSAGNDTRSKKGTAILVNVITGLVIIYTSWILIHSALVFLVQPQSTVYDVVLPWNEIKCNIK